jgi:putative component of membrane protein insertase Oxa1/YidC/SpoIIIJ protein YidD
LPVECHRLQGGPVVPAFVAQHGGDRTEMWYHCAMKWCLVVLFVVSGYRMSAQSADLNAHIQKQATRGLTYDKRPTRRWMDGKDQRALQWINPFWYVSGALLFVYQNVLSEQIQADCNFQLSCSGYTKRCIEQNGLLMGILLGADQLNTCQPIVYLDYETSGVNENGKVINDVPSH